MVKIDFLDIILIKLNWMGMHTRQCIWLCNNIVMVIPGVGHKEKKYDFDSENKTTN